MGARKASDPDFRSEREQIEALQDAATRVGAELEVLPSELDISGGLPIERRPSLRAAVEGVEQGRYSGIVVAYQSRLGRDVEQEEAVWRRVEAAGGQILMALDGLDTATVDGKMVRRIKSALNHAERERHIERFANLRRKATEEGIWQARQTPRGYIRDPTTRRLVPDEQAGVVRDAFHARARGDSISAIAEHLGMTTSGARHLLANRVYLGELHVGDHVNPTAHEPLVTRDEFLAAHAVTPSRKPRGTSGPALLAGLVRCCGCGHVMSRSRQKVQTYTCHGRMSAGRCPAPAAISAGVLEGLVEVIALGELAKLSTRATDDHVAIDAARQRLRDTETELATFLAGVSAAGIGEVDFAAAARQRREAIDQARTEFAAVSARSVPKVDGDPVRLWEVMSVEQRNRLLRGLIEAVLVRRAGGRGNIVAPADRVRVLAAGAGLVDTTWRRGGTPRPITSIALPDADDPAVLGMDLAE